MSFPRRGANRAGVRADSHKLAFRPRRPQTSTSCRHFQQGSCTWGAACRFSHAESLPAEPANESHQSARHVQAVAAAAEEYLDWKCTIKQNPHAMPPSHHLTVLGDCWSTALRILGGPDREFQQSLIRDLVDDRFHGLAYVDLTVGLNLGNSLHSPLRLPLRTTENFLDVIIHPSLLDCLSVDTHIGTLYNFLSGTNGTRAIPFFAGLCEALLQRHQAEPDEFGVADVSQFFEKIAIAMTELLRRERRASFHEVMSKLFEFMDRLAAILDTPEMGSEHRTSVASISMLKAMVDVAAGRLIDATAPVVMPRTSQLLQAAVYPMDHEFPNAKHDNDHQDVSQIQIMPTPGEMLSDKDDFLPSTDFAYPHFHENLVRRYLDTHFRLLRHDIFGPVKGLLYNLLESLKHGQVPARLPEGDLRAYLYSTATISHILVDDKRGFEAHVSFAPPSRLGSMSREDRKHWWENSDRLEQGALACIVFSAEEVPAPLMLVVSNKCTDLRAEHGLVSRQRLPTIAVTPANRGLNDFQQLCMAYLNRQSGVLIDFPGLILATFKPVLENLQRMLLSCELPFREWIIPGQYGTKITTAKVPPPKYARRPGFAFSLHSITKPGSAAMTLPASASPDDESLLDRLESSTELDRAQCRALITALTQEFALLQGPPGTGKSFLGVRLIQALLDCGVEDLGPIIVM